MIATSSTGRFLAVAACFLVMALFAESLRAQQIKVGTPLQRSSDSYFERQGINFGFFMNGNSRIRGLSPTGQILPNIVVSQNSVGSAIPQVGGFDPNTQLTSGVGVFGSNGGFSLGLFAGKGSSRSLTSTTRPSFFWYDIDFSEFDSSDIIDDILEKSVSYQKKDGRGHAHPSFFWYDND